MEITFSGKGEATEIAVTGEIDMNSSPALRKALVDTLKTAVPEVCVVLQHVDYLDSSGISTLLEGLQIAKQAGKSFILKSPSPAVIKTLEIACLDSIFSVVAAAD